MKAEQQAYNKADTKSCAAIRIRWQLPCRFVVCLRWLIILHSPANELLPDRIWNWCNPKNAKGHKSTAPSVMEVAHQLPHSRGRGHGDASDLASVLSDLIL